MPSVPRMPWGRHCGQPLSELETSYLVWVLERAARPAEWLTTAIRAELAIRFKAASAPPPPPPPRSMRHACPDPELAVDLVGAGLRSLAKRHHPDKGGDPDLMKKLNSTADWLKARVLQ